MSRIDTSKEQIVHDGRLYSLSPVKSFEVGKWYVYTETATTETLCDADLRSLCSQGFARAFYESNP